MDDLLVDLENASKRPAKQRTSQISVLVDKICSKAYENGLLDEELDKLIDIITLPKELDQASLGKLIRNLYPASKVSESSLIKVVSSLGNGRLKASYSTQAGLLRWLVMVYDVLENPQILSRLYHIIFNLLDTAAIRPQVCHVLALTSRRKHVRPFRIQFLMELVRRAGNEPPLIGLMRVYKDYYPDVIVGDATTGRASVFTHPDSEWRERFGKIQDAHVQKRQDGLSPEHQTFKILRKGMNGLKCRRDSFLPDVYTSHAQESSTTLEEIEDVHEFIHKLEVIELPNQLVAVLRDPLLQKFLQLRNSRADSSRIDSWLLTFFEDQLQSPNLGDGNILEMLDTILEYSRYTKQLLGACFSYLQSMILSWNGITSVNTILHLLAYLPITPFQDLYTSTLQPLEEAVLYEGTINSKVRVLGFYSSLLENWTTLLLSKTKPIPADGQAMKSMMEHVGILCLTVLQTSMDIASQSAVLDLYERAAFSTISPTLKTVVRISLPPAEVIYTLHFTSSLAIQSRLCALLAIYKKAFESAMTPNNATKQEPYSSVYVNGFNGFLMDLCNCLWRSKAFNTADPNAKGCLLDSNTNVFLSKYVSSIDGSLALPTLFTFSYSPLLCSLAISYIRELEDGAMDDVERRHAGPATQTSLKQLEVQRGIKLSWQEYRLGFLHYLERKGIPGIAALMYNTMKHLMPSREIRI